MVVRGAALDWPARSSLDWQWLRQQYTSQPDILQLDRHNCYFKCYKTQEFSKLGEVFNMSAERGRGEGKPWYVGWSVCHPTVQQSIAALISLPPFLASQTAQGNMWVFMGTPGEGAHLHLDHDLNLPTWQVCYLMSYLFFLMPHTLPARRSCGV